MSGKNGSIRGFSSTKRRTKRGLKRFFRKGKGIIRGSFQTTDSGVQSIVSTPVFPVNGYAEGDSESSEDSRGCVSLAEDIISLVMEEGGISHRTDRSNRRRHHRTLPFQTLDLFKNTFKRMRRSSKKSLTAKSDQSKDDVEKRPRSGRSLMSNGRDVSIKSNESKRSGSRKSSSRKGSSRKGLSEKSYLSFSSWKRRRRSASRKNKNRRDEYDSSDSFDDIEFSLSFRILPNFDDSKMIDFTSFDLDVDDVQEVDEEKIVEESDEDVEVLAVSRTPSFNVMLHANSIYSDSCTLIKRKSERITWEDLANNTKKLLEKEMMAEMAEESEGQDDDFRSVSLSSNHSKTSEIFGVRSMRGRGSFLVRQPSSKRGGSNRGGVPLWSGTSLISMNRDYMSFIVFEKTKEWLKQFKTCDPRYRILNFFNDVANEGATGVSQDFKRDHVSPLLKYFNRASVFTVWRPTSLQSIRRMMLGEGVGKGLDIKGKSAKRGKLSAFVPFMQIFKEEHKAKIRTLRRNGTIRIFFNSKNDRDIVLSNLNELAIELGETVRAAKQIIKEKEKHDDETFEKALQKMTLDMDDTTINIIDTYIDTDKYGIEVQERLFWEGMVMRQNISRKPASADDIGRSSMPSFQDMNFASLRKEKNSVPGGHTRAVILQYNPPGEEYTNPMSPLNLLMAYEENDPVLDRRRVIPVVSDFDCFIVGTRNVKYEEELPEDQVNVSRWMVEQIETILDKRDRESWTSRWLDVLKDAGDKGFHPKVPPLGYADPKTRFIFKHAIDRLSITGAVRHGAECYNFQFPQDLDNEVLVISDELPNGYNACNWTYVDQEQLIEILMFKIDRGFTFPLNPKWVLCDPGWKKVYDKLMASEMKNVQDSMRCFYPPTSGIRELIEKIHEKHPQGFQRFDNRIERMRNDFRVNGRSARFSNLEETYSKDLAIFQLKNYMILQRAKKKMRGFMVMNSILKSIRNAPVNKTATEEEIKNEIPSREKQLPNKISPKATQEQI